MVAISKRRPGPIAGRSAVSLETWSLRATIVVVSSLVAIRHFSSTTTLTVVGAAGCCVVAASVAALRVSSHRDQAAAAAVALSALAVAALLGTWPDESPHLLDRSVVLLIASSAIWLSVGRGSPPSVDRVFTVLTLSALAVATRFAWESPGGDGLSIALRVIAAALALDAAVASRGEGRRNVAVWLLMAVDVTGIDGLGVGPLESLAATTIGLLMLSWWWTAGGTDSRMAEAQVGSAMPGRLVLLEGICVVAGSTATKSVGWDAAADVLAAAAATGLMLVGFVAVSTLWERAAGVPSLERTAREIARRAQIDGLTGLPNRDAFERRLVEETERALRYRQPLALLFLDIDHFKVVNDTHGHAAGDHALVAVATALRSTARAVDVVCRYGGEELVVIAPGTWSADALNLAERLRCAVATTAIDSAGSTLTVSVGVAGLPEHAISAPLLMERADAALYEAKRSGRNRSSLAPGAGVSDPP